MSKVEVRPATHDDAPVIINSWLRSYRKSDFASRVRTSVYYDHHGPLVRSLLDRRGALIACSPRVHDEVLGWLVGWMDGDHLLLHYAYTLKLYRREFRVAAILLAAAGWKPGQSIVSTHPTWATDKIRKVKPDKYPIEYNQYRFLTEEAADESD